jgi:hypothetical protein
MRSYIIIAVAAAFLLSACGERIDKLFIPSSISCNVAEVTDTTIRIECNDGTTLELPAPPPETVVEEVEVPVEVIVEVPVIIEVPEECEDGKLTLCHKGETMELPFAAVAAHEGHGDALGACVPVPPCEGEDCEPPACEGEDCDGPVLVTLCHQHPDGKRESTKTVPAPAVPGHLGHGDYLGACESR